eukprot:1532957-Pyramimonas_sp.AAC.1
MLVRIERRQFSKCDVRLSIVRTRLNNVQDPHRWERRSKWCIRLRAAHARICMYTHGYECWQCAKRCAHAGQAAFKM